MCVDCQGPHINDPILVTEPPIPGTMWYIRKLTLPLRQYVQWPMPLDQLIDSGHLKRCPALYTREDNNDLQVQHNYEPCNVEIIIYLLNNLVSTNLTKFRSICTLAINIHWLVTV